MTTQHHVLVVDDVLENLQVVSGILHSNDIDVSAATSGEQALRAVEYDPPDLILLDISMPDMDGYEVCRRIKELPESKNVPVIFLTARNELGDIVTGFKSGAVDYITKPFKVEELLSRVNTHLELKRSRDIIQKQNEKISSQNKELMLLNSTKDKFFSIIAHDLKNPFQVLNNLAQLLIKNYEHYTTEKILFFLTTINKTTQQGSQLLENLLDWARSQTNKLERKPTTIKISEIVNENINLLSVVATEKEINLVNTVPDFIYAFADKNMINTVIRNLISNALKFTPKEGTITVDAQFDGDWTTISISDSGVGMTQDEVQKLFRIDVHHTTIGTNQEKGTGLGLILCHEFVTINEGKIWVESEREKGSKFIFTLPVNSSFFGKLH